MRKPTGNCFSAALHLMMGAHVANTTEEKDGCKLLADLRLSRDDLTLVHGEVEHPETGRHLHAWVEATNPTDGEIWCFDFANGNAVYLPASFYYAIGKIKPDFTWRYSFMDMAIKAVRFGHYGPWHCETPPRKTTSPRERALVG